MSVRWQPLEGDSDRYLALHSALDEPVADALLSQRELEVRSWCRDIVASEVAPRALEVDRGHVFVHESVQALMGGGLGGLVFPESVGGSGDTNVAYAIAMEEISAGCPSTSLVFMTQTHAAYPLYVAGSRELVDRYVPGLLDGSMYGSLAITEPGAGSDASALRSLARPMDDGSGFRLTGSKTFITTGDRSGVIICFATIDRELGRKGVTAFVLEGSWPGISRGRPFEKMGMHGSTTAELFFDDVEVPRDHVLGEPGDGWSVVMASVVKSRISAAAQGVGIARAAYARTLYALRSLHGNRIPEDAAFAMATLRGRLLQGRLLLLATARQVDTEAQVSAAQIGIMKQSCTDLAWTTALECTRILGVHGDDSDLGVERCLRDGKVTQIYDGTNEVQRILVGRDTARLMEEVSCGS